MSESERLELFVINNFIGESMLTLDIDAAVLFDTDNATLIIIGDITIQPISVVSA